VERIGSIKSKFPAEFDYGSSAQSTYNFRLRRVVHYLWHEIEVMFGNKGSNLIFMNLVAGDVISTAEIDFDQK